MTNSANVIQLPICSPIFSSSEGKEKTHDQTKSEHILDAENLKAMELRNKYPKEANSHHNMLSRAKDRGYEVDEALRKFGSFLTVAGPKPSPEHTIDRIDNEGGYTVDNIRWADKKTQNNNRSNNIMLTYQGETHTLAEWAEKRGLTYQTLYRRYRTQGLPVAQALGFEERGPKFSYPHEWAELAPPDPDIEFPKPDYLVAYKRFAKKYKYGERRIPPSVWYVAQMWREYRNVHSQIMDIYPASNECVSTGLEDNFDYLTNRLNAIGPIAVGWLRNVGAEDPASVLKWIGGK